MQKHSTNHRLLSPVCASCIEMAVRHRQTFSLPGSLITYSPALTGSLILHPETTASSISQTSIRVDSLSLSFRFNSYFPGEPGLAGVY